VHTVMSATEAKLHFGELLRRVSEGRESVLVERGGRPQVVVLSVNAYERLAGVAEDNEWRGRVQQARERIRAEIAGRELPAPEDVLRDVRTERNEQLDRLR
jgi:prevent-host-death family protein